MLKKLSSIVSILLLVWALCTGVQAIALGGGSFAEFPYIAQDGYTTVITDLAGEKSTFSGILDVSSLEQYAAVSRVAEYSIRYGGEEILCVQLRDVQSTAQRGPFSGTLTVPATNGYYATLFSYGEGNRYQAYITGLTPDNMEEVQSEVIAALLNRSYLDITDIGFIDTEKQDIIYNENHVAVDGDSNLCWAAATANLLHYTGWGAQAGFGSTDYLLECFADNFTDAGGDTSYGLSWFFNGIYLPQTAGASGWATVDATGDMAYGTFEGFLPQYAATSVTDIYDVEANPMALYDVFDRLENGYGVNLNYGYYSSGQRIGGHAITLWGYVLDTQASGRENCYALLVTDSDSDRTGGGNRRTAPNCLSYRTISPVRLNDVESWTFDCFSLDQMLSSFVTLAPYDASLPTDSGTHQAADLCVNSVTLYAVNSIKGREEACASFAADDHVCVEASFSNEGLGTSSASIPYRVEVIPELGDAIVRDLTQAVSGGLPTGYYTNNSDRIDFGVLEAGTYLLRVTVNPQGEGQQAEAFYTNNIYETTFTVSSRSYASSDVPSISISANYDGGNDNAYLRLNFSKEPPFEVAQYIVEICYSSLPSSQLLSASYCVSYWSDVLPEYVPLLPYKSYANVKVRVIPADSTGYAVTVVPSGSARLSYYSMEISATSVSYTAVSETDTKLKNSETFSFSAKNDVLFSQPNPQASVLGYHCEHGTKTVIASSCKSSGNSWLSSSYSYSQSTFDACLTPGEYELWAVVSYAPVVNNQYMNSERAYLGNLTVFASAYGELVVEKKNVSSTAAQIGYSFETPDAAFTVRITYQGTGEPKTKTVPYSRWESGLVSGSLTLQDLTPSTDYTYMLEVFSGSNTTAAAKLTSESGGFTTAGSSEDSPAITALDPGENALTLRAGTNRFQSFVPTAGGTWRFTFSGPDGAVLFWNESAKSWGAQTYFTTSGKSFDVAVQTGKSVYFRIISYTAGEFHVKYEPTDVSYYRDSSSLRLGFSLSDSQKGIVSLYDAGGKQLSSPALKQGEGYHVITASNGQAQTLRLFYVDKNTYVPSGPARVFQCSALAQ